MDDLAESSVPFSQKVELLSNSVVLHAKGQMLDVIPGESCFGYRSVSINTDSVVDTIENEEENPGEYIQYPEDDILVGVEAPVVIPITARRARSLLKPAVLAPNSRHLQSEEEMSRNADALGALYEEIRELVKEHNQMLEKASVTCIGLTYRFDPPEVFRSFKTLQGLIAEYEKRLTESYPSILARNASDKNLLRVFTKHHMGNMFEQEIVVVQEVGGKQVLKQSYWQGMKLSFGLTGFLRKQMEANYAFSEVMHARPELMRIDFSPACYAIWISSNLDYLRILYQVRYACEQLEETHSEAYRWLNNEVVQCGLISMKEICDLLRFSYKHQWGVNLVDMLTRDRDILMQWLDNLDLEQFDNPQYARNNSRRLFYTVIGYCLLGEIDKACLCTQRMIKALPSGAIEKGDIFLLVLNQTYLVDLLFQCGENDISRDLLRVSTYDKLLKITQVLCEKSNEMDFSGVQVLPDDLYYDFVRLIHCVSLVLKKARNNLEVEEKKLDDAVKALVDAEELEKKTVMEARLKHQRESVRKKKYRIRNEQSVKNQEVVAAISTSEDKQEFKLHSDICSAINLYLLKVPFEDVEKRLEVLLRGGAGIDVALAQYALADMLHDKIKKTIKVNESYLPVIKQYEGFVEQNILPDLRLDYLFLEAMQAYTHESGPLNEDLNHLYSVVSMFNNSCSDGQELLHDIAEKMVEIHNQLDELTRRGKGVAKNCKKLKKLYQLRGALLRNTGKAACKGSDKASFFKDASKVLKERGDQIVAACASLKALASWEVCHRARQILVDETLAPALLVAEVDQPCTRLGVTQEAMHYEESDTLLFSGHLEAIELSQQETVDFCEPRNNEGLENRVNHPEVILGGLSDQAISKPNMLVDLGLPALVACEGAYASDNDLPETDSTNSHPVMAAESYCGEESSENKDALLSSAGLESASNRAEDSVDCEDSICISETSAVQVDIADCNNVFTSENAEIAGIDQPGLQAVFGHVLPDSFVKASCDSVKEKGCTEKLRAREELTSEKTASVKGKSKKAKKKQRKQQARLVSQTKASEKAEVQPHELESRFNSYVEGYIKKGILRSGTEIPRKFDADRWLKRYHDKVLFSLDEVEAFTSVWSNAFEPFDYSDLMNDLMVYAEALQLRIKAELDHEVVSIFLPDMKTKTVHAGVATDEYDIKLVRVGKEWFVSHEYYWENYA